MNLVSTNQSSIIIDGCSSTNYGLMGPAHMPNRLYIERLAAKRDNWQQTITGN